MIWPHYTDFRENEEHRWTVSDFRFLKLGGFINEIANGGHRGSRRQGEHTGGGMDSGLGEAARVWIRGRELVQ